MPSGTSADSPPDGRAGFDAGHSDGPKNPAPVISVPSVSLNAIRGQTLWPLRSGSITGGSTADCVNSADDHAVRWKRGSQLAAFPPPTVPRTFTDDSPRDGGAGFDAGHSDGPKNPALLMSLPSASPNVIRGQIFCGLRGPEPEPES